MISIDTLQNSIYQKSHFTQHSGRIVKSETQVETGKLEECEFCFHGTITEVSKELLKNCKDIFCKVSKDLSFSCECDGIFLLEKDGTNYILFVELKSNFNKRAIMQIAISDIRYKLLCCGIDGFDINDYQEIGLIISYPPTSSVTDNSSYKLAKTEMVMELYKRSLYALNEKLIKDKQVMLNDCTFQWKPWNVAQRIKPINLVVRHIEVPKGRSSCSIDLDSVL